MQITHDKVAKSVEEARGKLLDLTLRNRLLNFRPSLRNSLHVLEPSWEAIYQRLVIEQKTLGFAAKPKQQDPGRTEQAPSSQHKARSKSQTGSSTTALLVDIAEEKLRDALFHIAHEAHSAVEEQGYTVLYLALGFLKWEESKDSEQQRMSPLILVPVEISRTEARTKYRLQWSEEDIGSNLSLLHKMTEFDVSLPELESSDSLEDIAKYFQNVREAITAKESWSCSEDVYLGFFSFTKFVMYKDLDTNEWPAGQGPASHPLIRALFAPEGKPTEDAGLLREDEVDDRLNWSQTRYVLDADPSQIVAIEAAKAGHNLVVEGPPGTGKSQTIANMIGELLMEGETVLFVSEKMAALEVVKSRLDRVGLGDFCLELHSRKARKTELMRELERSINTKSTNYAKPRSDGRESLSRHIKELDAYASALRKPFGSMRYSPYQLFEIRERAIASFPEVTQCHSTVRVSGEWTTERIDQVADDLLVLSDLLDTVGSADENPWRSCDPGLMLPREVEAVSDKLNAINLDLQKLIETTILLEKNLKLNPIRTLNNADQIANALELLAKRPPISLVDLALGDWDTEKSEMLANAVYLLSNLQVRRDACLAIFKEEALEAPVMDLYASLASERNGLIPIFRKRYRLLAKQATTLYKEPPSMFSKKLRTDLQMLVQYQQTKTQLHEYDDMLGHIFGSLWQGEISNAERLHSIATWIDSLVPYAELGILTHDSWVVLDQEIHSEILASSPDKLHVLASKVTQALNELIVMLNCDKDHPSGIPLAEHPLNAIRETLDRWSKPESIGKLQNWAKYRDWRRKESLKNVASLIEILEEGAIDAANVRACLEYSIAETELQQVFAERPALAEFVGEVHEGKVKRFQELDREIIKKNRALVAKTMASRRPPLRGGASRDSQAGILLAEINKKRRHMPIRKLMAQAGSLIQRYKPCFMMSPLSIAQFLDPRIAQFDVVIFDEASQVRPEDALGALLRAKQAVVMGDTKQLPPTSFFDHFADDPEDDEADSVGDIESILHLCRRSFPSESLRWHYRSKHETLIAVSNEEFYDNQLVVYPSPMQHIDGLGLRMVHLPDTKYDRGRTAQNRQEAIAVARAAIQHFRDTPDRSLGVGAFSVKQQTAILEELERELDEHPEMTSHFSRERTEHFFVKNLETIQGDERDVIYLSIGYGFDRYGKLSTNFGPLNRTGGERRLNVLITRARKECVVFSNFTADDLAVTPHSPKGIRSLKAFLQFAETHVLATTRIESRDTDSPFEDAVYDFLRSEALEVHKQVGSAGYRIDLAVPDPRLPGRYLLGIECDGAKYHSSRVARERDRLRQQILESLGWRIYRIWSTDWYTQRSAAQDQLLKAVKRAMSTSPQMPTSQSLQTVTKSHKRDLKEERHTLRAKPRAPSETSRADTQFSKRRSSNNRSPHYKECSNLSIRIMNTIPNTPRSSLAQAVVDVVDVEGPIHIREVVRRIRLLWGLKRSGKRIQEAIIRGAEFAYDQGLISYRGEFLCPADEKKIEARYRDDPHMLNIDLICDEELKEAVKVALQAQYATPKETLPVAAARSLGFRQTSRAIRERLANVIDDMLKEEQLVQLPNGMLDLPQHTGK